ncbi:MAG: aldo/keto reductase [Oscillospiraceae bacterium]|nr:aldo/keto reductase [Oscillospiraceae bacterium]
MDKIRFGKTGLMVSKIAFGGIPIQRLSVGEAVKVVRGAINLGVNFIDTANGYSDSEEKIGLAIKDVPRDSLVLASKSGASDKKMFLSHLDLSLTRLGVDFIDLYQLHGVSSEEGYNAVFAEGGAYEGLEEAVRAGKVRFPAFSSHNIPVAMRIMREGRFAAVQLPFNYVDDEATKEAIPLAKELDMGFIAMKPFGGGLLSDANLSIKYLSQFDNIIPDPGIEKLSEMEEIARIIESNGPFTPADGLAIEKAKAELGSRWCHRCDYCRPCPQNIGISMVLNVESIMKRLPADRTLAMAGHCMETARNCTECRACVKKCPYNLDVPALIKEKLALWAVYVSENTPVCVD